MNPFRSPARIRALTLLTALMWATGCAEDAAPADPDGSDTDGTELRVSYYDDVRPLLHQNCVSCHTDGSIAPLSLDSYDAVAAVAPLVKAVTQARTMPPYGVRADGSCQEFADPRWLSDEEIETIAAWVDGGMLAGDETIAAPQIPALPALVGDDIQQVVTPPYEPRGDAEIGQGVDDYQCFLVDLGLERERHLVGFDVVPGNDAIVHHVLGFRVDPAFLGNGETIAELDAMTEGEGWDCYGAAGDGVLPKGVPVTWAPGQGAVRFPAQSGVRFEPGDVMVVQMHYNLLEARGVDSTRIELEWSDEVEREGFQVLWDPFLFESFGGNGPGLTPGMPSVEYRWNATFAEMLSFDGLDFASVDLWGVIPHMHARGRAMSIGIDRAGAMECAADVDRYDYNWQRTYFYADPISVTMDDALDVVCDFDTSKEQAPVKGGFGTQEEMCLVGLYFTAD